MNNASMVERVTKDVSSDTDGSLLCWKLLGSADGDEWHVLRQHENDTSLGAGKKKIQVVHVDRGGFVGIRLRE